MFGKNRDSSAKSLSTIGEDDNRSSTNAREQETRARLRDSLDKNTTPQMDVRPPTFPVKLKRGNSMASSPSYYEYDDRTTTPPQLRRQLTRMPSVQTRYMDMLLHLDQIPRLHNILAAAFTWILLAGFLVVPGTFTSMKNSQAFKEADEDKKNQIAHAIVHSIANVGLLWLSGAFCLIGGVGCLWLWWCWRRNFVWLINRIFLPALLNSIAGLLTTVVNVYTAQKGVWSVTAKLTAYVTSSFVAVAGVLFLLYNFMALRKVRQEHDRHIEPEKNEFGRNKNRESMVEKFKRKAHEPALVPGSVV